MSDELPLASNPFFAKAIIQDPEMFFGRADLLSRVYEMVAHRQCASIVGPVVSANPLFSGTPACQNTGLVSV